MKLIGNNHNNNNNQQCNDCFASCINLKRMGSNERENNPVYEGQIWQ